MKLATLPRIIEVDDYHILLNLSYDIQQFLGIKIKCKELACNSNYIGIVYQGRLPNKQIINRLLRAKGIVFEKGI